MLDCNNMHRRYVFCLIVITEMLLQTPWYLVQRWHNQWWSEKQNWKCHGAIWSPPDFSEKTQTEVVWACHTIIWTGQDYPTGNSSRRETKRQTEETMGRQHQRVDWPWVEHHTAESREPWGEEEAGCKISSGAPTVRQTAGQVKVKVKSQSQALVAVGVCGGASEGGLQLYANVNQFWNHTCRAHSGRAFQIQRSQRTTLSGDCDYCSDIVILFGYWMAYTCCLFCWAVVIAVLKETCPYSMRTTVVSAVKFCSKCSLRISGSNRKINWFWIVIQTANHFFKTLFSTA